MAPVLLPCMIERWLIPLPPELLPLGFPQDRASVTVSSPFPEPTVPPDSLLPDFPSPLVRASVPAFATSLPLPECNFQIYMVVWLKSQLTFQNSGNSSAMIDPGKVCSSSEGGVLPLLGTVQLAGVTSDGLSLVDSNICVLGLKNSFGVGCKNSFGVVGLSMGLHWAMKKNGQKAHVPPSKVVVEFTRRSIPTSISILVKSKLRKIFWILKSCNLLSVEEFSSTFFHLFETGRIFFPLLDGEWSNLRALSRDFQSHIGK
ncbi:unnamed protein product [Arabis nemorensis]|uniref:Uncharacterized protein n=1 Tax=Arabis nemorensis TaxID=586526 RepID=A0A565AVG1_9BRAS|nr:unnamed protein product [Arabis nemorensis]